VTGVHSAAWLSDSKIPLMPSSHCASSFSVSTDAFSSPETSSAYLSHPRPSAYGVRCVFVCVCVSEVGVWVVGEGEGLCNFNYK